MPSRPSPACRVCRRKHCTDPTHQPKPKPSGWHRSKASEQRRPRGRTEAERKRRAAVVAAHRAQYGNWCPRCGNTNAKLTADHITPVGLGGAEDGPLRVLCRDCQNKQGSAVGHIKQRHW